MRRSTKGRREDEAIRLDIGKLKDKTITHPNW